MMNLPNTMGTVTGCSVQIFSRESVMILVSVTRYPGISGSLLSGSPSNLQGSISSPAELNNLWASA